MDLFSIDAVRKLKDQQQQKPVLHARRFFIVAFKRIPIESQNALLKVLEEPVSTTHLILVTHTTEHFLPTVLSRVHVVAGDRGKNEETRKKAIDFLTSTKAERIKMIKPLIDSKDKAMISSFLSELERELYEGGIKENQKGLEELLRVKGYINDRGASLKILLEHIALSI